MKQITEDYCSFEIAQLLKEKGFDWQQSPFYSEQDMDGWKQENSYQIPNPDYDPNIPFDTETITMVAPHISQSIALKWLREVHSIHIIPYFDKIQPSDLPYSFAVYIVDEYTAIREIIACFDIDENLYWGKQEQAIEAALKYALENLI